MEYTNWRTTLRCENHHEHVDDITWMRPLIEEPSEPARWRPDIAGMMCRDPDCASQVEAVSAAKLRSAQEKPRPAGGEPTGRGGSRAARE